MDYLELYIEIVCKAKGHAHGSRGLQDCLMEAYAERKLRESNLASGGEAVGA